MTRIVNLIHFSEETTAAAEEALTVIPTQYSDLTVSAVNFVGIGVAMLLPVVAAVIGCIFVYRRYSNWLNKFLAGILAGLVSMVAMSAITYIPAFSHLSESNYTVYSLVCTALMLALEMGGLYLAEMWIKSSSEKRMQKFDLGAAFSIALGFFFIQIMTNSIFNYCMNYFAIFLTVNSDGFDYVASSIYQSYASAVEGTGEAIPTIESVANQLKMAIESVTKELVSTSVALVTYASAVTCALSIMYGWKTEKLTTAQFMLAPLFLFVFYVPSFVSCFVAIDQWIRMAILIVVAAVEIFVTIKLIKEYMPEDWKQIRHPEKRESNKRGGRGRYEQPKMPKIVMPKD